MQKLAQAWDALGLPVDKVDGELRTMGKPNDVQWVNEIQAVSADTWPIQEAHTGVRYTLELGVDGAVKVFQMHAESVPHPDFCEVLTSPKDAPLTTAAMPGTRVSVGITAHVFMKRERCERSVRVLGGSFVMPEKVYWLGKGAPGLQMMVCEKGLLYVHLIGTGAISAVAIRANIRTINMSIVYWFGNCSL